MNKNDIKKIILSIIFIVFLVIFFLVAKNLKGNIYNKKISIIKNIIKERNEEIVYKNNNNYIYSMNKEDGKYIYKIYDLNGNRLYTIKSEKNINIITVKKRYYITYDDNYHLYTEDSEKILSASSIESLNDYLIKVDDKIINNYGEILFSDVHSVRLFNNSNNININNTYLTDKKGNVILDKVYVSDEIKNGGITDYLIIKKGNKYYTFFTNLENIIGDGFDSYEIRDLVYIKINDTYYKIYKTGLRKKIKSFTKSSNEIIKFDNGYKTKKNKKEYILYNKNGKEVLKQKKQIVLNNHKVTKGKINDEVYIYNLKNKKYISAKKIKVANSYFYTYENNKKYIVSTDFTKKYKSDDYLSYDKNVIVKKNKNKIKFLNLSSKKEYVYEIKNKEEIVNDYPFRNIIILESDKYIKIIDTKGNNIKTIKNRKVLNYYYNEEKGKIIIITGAKYNNVILKGSYVGE